MRFFYLSLEEAIYKCENATCFYPFEHFTFKRLSDNKLYYYEEIQDNGREVFLRVPLDGQGINESINPLSTKLFCDSQRNPDIENYDCDFSDLFDDNYFEEAPETQKPSTSVAENPDFLEFLDVGMEQRTDVTNDKVLEDNGINGIIDKMLIDSPLKNTSTTNSAKTKCSKPKPVAKLSKCIKHIEKAKNSKSPHKSEKPPKTFAAALKKVRTGQNQSVSEIPVVKCESEIKTELKPNEIKRVVSMIKSTSKLRPTELANTLKSIDISTTSNFLRQYMKTKENQLFSDETSCSTNSTIDSKSMISLLPSTSPQIDSEVEQKPITVPHASENAKTTKQTKPRRAAQKKQKDSTDTVEKVQKKERKPRVTKPKKSVAEPVNDSSENKPTSGQPTIDAPVSKVETEKEPKTKEIKAPKKKRVSTKKEPVDQPLLQQLTSKENIQIGSEVTETKKRCRKKNPPMVGNDGMNAVKDEKIVDSVKKPRKRKCADDSSKTDDQTVNQEPKPKRKRTKKETPIESGLMSLPILFDTGKL